MSWPKPTAAALERVRTLPAKEAAQFLQRGAVRFRRDPAYFELTVEEQIALQIDYETVAEEHWNTMLVELRQSEAGHPSPAPAASTPNDPL